MSGTLMAMFRVLGITRLSFDIIGCKLSVSLVFIFCVCLSTSGLSEVPSEEFSLELQNVITENHDNSFKRWSRKSIGSGLPRPYHLCEEGFLLTQEENSLVVMDLNKKLPSQRKYNFNGYKIISCLSEKDGDVIIFSSKVGDLSESGGYRILRAGSQVVEITATLDYYYENGILKIVCADDNCMKRVDKYISAGKRFQMIKGRKVSRDLIRNYYLTNVNLKGYNTYLKVVNGHIDPSKLFCAPHKAPFLIKNNDIALCTTEFQKYIYASQAIFLDDSVIIRMDDPPALDEICNRDSQECRPLMPGSASPFGSYRIKNDAYYQYGNNDWGLGPFIFCRNKINKNCLSFDSEKEAVVEYFEIGENRFTISMKYKIKSVEDVVIGDYYINYAPKP